MEKAEVVTLAPHYYAVAIAAYLSETRNIASKSAIQYEFEIDSRFEEHAREHLLPSHACFERALELLELEDFIVMMKDKFGPALIAQSNSFATLWQMRREDVSTIEGKYRLGGRVWLHDALLSIADHFERLGITEADFSDAGAWDVPEQADEWAPLPIERPDPKIAEIVDRLTRLEEEVRGSNGYGDVAPDEREHVLTSLRSTIQKFRESGSISVGFLRRYALEPLRSLAGRFAGAVIGEAAVSTARAITQWVRDNFIPF